MSALLEVAIKLESIPVLRNLLDVYYKRKFATTGFGMALGIFHDFQEAARSAPRSQRVGFDFAEEATLYQDRLLHIFPEDYPVLFWLRPLLHPGVRVFDFGGHRGTHFYTYAKYLTYPNDLNWTVCEVPAVVTAGQELAKQRDACHLHFTSDFQAADGASVFLANGSLQYVDSPMLAGWLAGMPSAPPHVILNKFPIYDGKPYVTLQNGGVAFHPFHVFNRADFLASLEKLGYQLVDLWPVPTRHGHIPFHREASFPNYSGLYFRRRS